MRFEEGREHDKATDGASMKNSIEYKSGGTVDKKSAPLISSSWVTSAGAYCEDISDYRWFHRLRVGLSAEQLPANINRLRKIDRVAVLAAVPLDYGVGGDARCKVVHDDPPQNLLTDECGLFAVEIE